MNQNGALKTPCYPGGLTVLMSVYKNDKPDLLVKAVQSCFENSLPPNKFILVIDGELPSKTEDAVNTLISRYDIKSIKLQQNVGLARALNIGLTHVDTDWVARADADDYNKPKRFETQRAALEKHGFTLDIIGTAIEEIDSEGNLVAIRRTATEHDKILNYIKARNPFNHMTVIFRTSKALEAGGYPNIFLKEDYALWAKMLAQGAKSANIDSPLVIASAGRDMFKRRGGVKYALAEIELQRHLIKLGLKSSYMGFIHGVLRSTIFVMPSKMREIFYLKFLRHKD